MIKTKIIESVAYGRKNTYLGEEKILYLDATNKTFQKPTSTPRKEYATEFLYDDSFMIYRVKILQADNYKEFTILQILNVIDEEYKPFIRFCVIDESIYITYKDKENVNHYTKVDNFEINKEYEFKIEVFPDFVSINNGKWKYENWLSKYRYQYGIYSQTDFGQYKIEILKVNIEKNPNK